MRDEKYVVLKKNDWEQLEQFGEEAFWPVPLEGAVVIRTGDLFATGGLWAYAHSIQTMIELTRVTAREFGIEPDVARLKELEEVRDYFSERAMEAEEVLVRGQAKLPD